MVFEMETAYREIQQAISLLYRKAESCSALLPLTMFLTAVPARKGRGKEVFVGLNITSWFAVKAFGDKFAEPKGKEQPSLGYTFVL